jgi:hypothetical protein
MFSANDLSGNPNDLVLQLDSMNESNEATLFFIERSKDNNRIYYDLSLLSNGKLNPGAPIEIYWLKCAKTGKIPLSLIQRKLAYGINFSSISEDQASFKFVSYDKMEFLLKSTLDGYKVFAKLEKQSVEVENIYVVIKGGTFWLPKVPEVHLRYRTSDGQLNNYKLIVNKDG